MNKTAKIIFFTYQLIFRTTNRSCRFEPTCSEYFVKSTEKYGFFKGSFKSIIRIMSCHPFSKKPIYDPA